ncbi:N-acetyltransferase [Pseudopedobacter beijingensis]|uniref:GNAT family N-acetyltransferase n=1 Tax=Pseudopedobacter beijingensis TaxID=1207056 RepID=A0ABW4I894_9SPHI
MENFINLNLTNIDQEHICCAISDKKCNEGYQLKKEWLKKELDNGYVFRKLDARAKVFIEYGDAEKGWAPVLAPNYLLINCFWVSGQYKNKGYGKQLLQYAIDDAKSNHKSGLVTVVGTRKFHFMSDTKWLLKQGFVTVETTDSGFSLLAYKFDKQATDPVFNKSVKSGECDEKKGITVYYSNRCPFAEFHVNTSMVETAAKRKLPLTLIKLDNMEQAQNAPSPATIFSLFFNGKFITTDLSACMDSRFDKIIKSGI